MSNVVTDFIKDSLSKKIVDVTDLVEYLSIVDVDAPSTFTLTQEHVDRSLNFTGTAESIIVPSDIGVPGDRITVTSSTQDPRTFYDSNSSPLHCAVGFEPTLRSMYAFAMLIKVTDEQWIVSGDLKKV